MLGCGKFLSVGGEFVVQQVVELLWARPLVVSVAGVRVVAFDAKRASRYITAKASRQPRPHSRITRLKQDISIFADQLWILAADRMTKLAALQSELV